MDFKVKTLHLLEKRVKLQIWDTAGQETSEKRLKGLEGVVKQAENVAKRMVFDAFRPLGALRAFIGRLFPWCARCLRGLRCHEAGVLRAREPLGGPGEAARRRGARFQQLFEAFRRLFEGFEA